MSVHREWDKYTDDEILNLPYDLPGIASADDPTSDLAMILMEGVDTKCFRNRFQNLAGYRTFRDLLFFHNHTYGNKPHLRLPEKQVFWNELSRQQLRRGVRFTDTERANIMSEISHLSSRWPRYYQALDQKLRARIERIGYRPLTTQEYIERHGVESLIPFRHLTLAGVPLREYTVKKGRIYQSSPEIIIPNWKFTEEECPRSRLVPSEITVWRNAWANLLWHDRPRTHLSLYWRLLQNRVLLAWKPNSLQKSVENINPRKRGRPPSSLGTTHDEDDDNSDISETPTSSYPSQPSQASSNPTDETLNSNHSSSIQSRRKPNNTPSRLDPIKDPVDIPESKPWAIDECNICKEKDSARHAFLRCPPVHLIWSQAIELLPSLLYPANLRNLFALEEAEISIFNIIFGFPDLVKSVQPKHKRHHVTLWHSAVIYVIRSTRTEAVWRSRTTGTQCKFDWGNDDRNSMIKRIKHEIRQTVYTIFTAARQSGKQDIINDFKVKWCDEGTWFSVDESKPRDWKLIFHQ
jgi:hypothetical protein